MDLRKYHMAQQNAAQHSVEFHKEAIARLDSDETGSNDVAEAPANGGAARQAAARTAAAAVTKKTAKPAAVVEEEETEAVEDDGLSFLDEDAPEVAALTEDDLKVAIKKFAAAFGKAKVTDLLAKYKAKAIQDVKPAKYEELISLVDKALAKHKK